MNTNVKSEGAESKSGDDAPPDRNEFRIRRPGKLSTAIAGRIRREIVTGGLATDDQLPPASELARLLGAGKATVREALHVLEAEGLITIQQGASGARVNRPDTASLSRQLGYLMQLSSASLQEIYMVRRDLESLLLASLALNPAPAIARVFADEARAALAHATEGVRLRRPEIAIEGLIEFQAALRRHAPNRVLGWLVELVGTLSFREQIEESGRRIMDDDTRLKLYEWGIAIRREAIAMIEQGANEKVAGFWHDAMDDAIVRLGRAARPFEAFR